MEGAVISQAGIIELSKMQNISSAETISQVSAKPISINRIAQKGIKIGRAITNMTLNSA